MVVRNLASVYYCILSLILKDGNWSQLQKQYSNTQKPKQYIEKLEWNTRVRIKSINYINLFSKTLPNFPVPLANSYADSLLGEMTQIFIPEAYEPMVSMSIRTVVPGNCPLALIAKHASA